MTCDHDGSLCEIKRDLSIFSEGTRTMTSLTVLHKRVSLSPQIQNNGFLMRTLFCPSFDEE